MDSEKRKDLAIEFINKLIEGANNSCQTKYKLRFANSTNPFFKKHNIFRRTIKEKIMNFTINNYHYGPTQDHDGYPGKVWEFGFTLGI